MKAMILAAGLGTRMRPLTDSCPKPLLRVANKALIDYHLEKLAAIGITEVVVNCSWLAEQVITHLDGGTRFGLRVLVSEEEQPLETAGGIVKALPMLLAADGADEQFLLINGDVWADYDFAALCRRRTEAAHLVLIDNPEHHPEGDFYLTESDVVAEEGGDQRLTFAGISLWSTALFRGLAEGSRSLKSVLLGAMDQGRVTGEYFSGSWWDVGTPQRLAELDNYLARKPADKSLKVT